MCINALTLKKVIIYTSCNGTGFPQGIVYLLFCLPLFLTNNFNYALLVEMYNVNYYIEIEIKETIKNNRILFSSS